MRNKAAKMTLLCLGYFLLSGCAGQQLTNREAEVKGFKFDFRSYSEKGFLFTPEEYFGRYDVLGIISLQFHPKVTYRQGHFPVGQNYSVRHFVHDGVRTQMTHEINRDEIIEYVHDLAVEWGGDALSHFNFRFESAQTDDNPQTTYLFLTVEGVVIKRLD
jgi:hypothetical protein